MLDTPLHFTQTSLDTECVCTQVLLPFPTPAHTESEVNKVLTRKSQLSLFIRMDGY